MKILSIALLYVYTAIICNYWQSITCCDSASNSPGVKNRSSWLGVYVGIIAAVSLAVRAGCGRSCQVWCVENKKLRCW